MYHDFHEYDREKNYEDVNDDDDGVLMTVITMLMMMMTIDDTYSQGLDQGLSRQGKSPSRPSTSYKSFFSYASSSTLHPCERVSR